MKKIKVLALTVSVLLVSQSALFAQTAIKSVNIDAVYQSGNLSVKDSYVPLKTEEDSAAVESPAPATSPAVTASDALVKTIPTANFVKNILAVTIPSKLEFEANNSDDDQELDESSSMDEFPYEGGAREMWDFLLSNAHLVTGTLDNGKTIWGMSTEYFYVYMTVLEGQSSERENLIFLIGEAIKSGISFEEFSAFLDKALEEGVSLQELANMFAYESTFNMVDPFGGFDFGYKNISIALLSAIGMEVGFRALVDASAKAEAGGGSLFSLIYLADTLSELSLGYMEGRRPYDSYSYICNMVIGLVNTVCDNGGSVQDLANLFCQAINYNYDSAFDRNITLEEWRENLITPEAIVNLINDVVSSGLDINTFFAFMKKASDDGASIREVFSLINAAKTEGIGMTIKQLVGRLTVNSFDQTTGKINTTFINIKNVIDRVQNGATVNTAILAEKLSNRIM